MDKRMLEENATVVSVVTQVVSSVALVVLAGVAVMMWKGGSLGFGSPSAAAPSAAAPDQGAAPVTQLPDDQWKEVLDNAVNIEGNKDAKVTMVEFTDFQCPFCEQYFTNTYGQIKKNFVDTNKVRYITENLPLPFHPNAHISAEAAACAGDQKKFWEMHAKLFSNQNAWANEADPKATFQKYAKDIGINDANFAKCLTDGKFKAAVDKDAALAAKVGANGTPTFIINGKMVVGAQPYAEFEKVLNEALAE